MARAGESDAIVQQLERGLPRWPGLVGELGWMTETVPERHLELVQAIKGHKDAVYVHLLSIFSVTESIYRGNRYAVVLESIPEDAAIPYLSFSVRAYPVTRFFG